MSSLPPIPEGWPELQPERERPYFQALEAFIEEERGQTPVYPPQEDVFRALDLAPQKEARVVLLGQDPYHGPGQAHGLAFSVPSGVASPPSLRNLLRELHDDTGASVPNSGDLTSWAEQGVLLLNTVLTVRAGEAGSHAGAGWEAFTDAVLQTVVAGRPRVFILLGNRARACADALDLTGHSVIEAPHPSPLAAYRGFFGSRIFSRANEALEALGEPPVDWSLA